MFFNLQTAMIKHDGTKVIYLKQLTDKLSQVQVIDTDQIIVVRTTELIPYVLMEKL